MLAILAHVSIPIAMPITGSAEIICSSFSPSLSLPIMLLLILQKNIYCCSYFWFWFGWHHDHRDPLLKLSISMLLWWVGVVSKSMHKSEILRVKVCFLLSPNLLLSKVFLVSARLPQSKRISESKTAVAISTDTHTVSASSGTTNLQNWYYSSKSNTRSHRDSNSGYRNQNPMW